MKRLCLLVLILFACIPDYAQMNAKRLNEQVVEAMKDILLKENNEKLQQYFADINVCKKAKASLANSSAGVAAFKTTRDQLIYSRKYFNDSEVVTFAYASVTPVIFCRVELGTSLNGSGRLIRSFHLTPSKDVTGEDEFLKYITNMWGDDTPPPMKEIEKPR